MSNQLSVIGRYEIVSRLGRGDLSVVFKARDPLTNKEVAVKTLASEPESSSERAVWRDNFQAAIEAAGRLTHPNIVRLLDAGEHGGNLFVVMELVDGKPLSALLPSSDLGLSEKLTVALQMVDALAFAHSHGVVHHALQPSNVLVTPELKAKLADFGLSQLGLPLTVSTPTPFRPRPHYRSPEQLLGRKVDARTDVFSFGVLLFEMLAGHVPFAGDGYIKVTQQILNADRRRLIADSGLQPPALAELVRRCLAKDPLDRYQSARAVHRELCEVLDVMDRTPDEAAVTKVDVPGDEPSGFTARLIVEEDGRRRVAMLGETLFSIGRRSDNELVLSDQHVSRRHARIFNENGRFILEDVKSRHGTYLNGRKIERAVLSQGDRIQIGKTRRFSLTFVTAEDVDVSSWSSPPPVVQDKTATHHLEVLLDVVRALSSSLNVDDVLNIIMDSALDCTEAQRGFLMLREENGCFAVRIARHFLDEEMRAQDSTVSQSVVDRCINSGQCVIIHDVDQSQDFRESESIVSLKLKSIVSVPLVLKGEVIGVLYLDSRRARGPLRPDQVELLRAIAAQAAISLENARLYEMATLDPLTRLYDRRHFEKRLEEEYRRSLRRRSPLSLIFLDVDRFKSLNDTHGHLVGDRVLKQVAQVLPANARVSDIPARYGGEEFVLLTPETPADQAAVLAERIREQVNALAFEEENQTIKVTVSVGVSTLEVNRMERAKALVEAADRAMFRAKALGGDRTFIDPESK